jgi:predicted metalloprotease
MKHQFQNMKDQFNGKTEKMRPPPYFIGHEVYKMVKNVHGVHSKRKRIGKNIEEDDM